MLTRDLKNGYTPQLVTNLTQEEGYRTKEVKGDIVSAAARTMR